MARKKDVAQEIDLSLKAAIYVVKSRPADCHLLGAGVQCWARVHVNEKNRLTPYTLGGKEHKEYRYREYRSEMDSMTDPKRLCAFVDNVEGASKENKEAAKAEIRNHFAIDLVTKK